MSLTRLSEDGVWQLCNGDDDACEEKIKNHAWGQIKADDWFFRKDGRSYCPKHIPDWVKAWRKKRARKAK